MSNEIIMNPLIAIEENCTMLKEAGADNQTINYFLLEALAELEGELETALLNEFSITDFLGGVGGAIKGGLGIIGDSIKEKITRFILDMFGIADGWIKEIIVKFVGNLTIRECISLVRGNLDCDVIMTKSAQTMAEVVAEKYLINPLVQDSGGVNPASTKAGKDAQIAELFRGIIRNALSGSDADSPLPRLLKPHMKPICDFFDEAAGGVKKALMQENFHRELIEINLQKKPIKENFQKRMKVRLKKSMKTILDGGRKDLVKYGKPWSQGRQKYSNAFAANEVTSVTGIEGAPMTLKDKQENKK